MCGWGDYVGEGMKQRPGMLTVGSRIPCGLKTSVFHSLEKELIPVADTLDLSKQELASVPGGYG